MRVNRFSVLNEAPLPLFECSCMWTIFCNFPTSRPAADAGDSAKLRFRPLCVKSNPGVEPGDSSHARHSGTIRTAMRQMPSRFFQYFLGEDRGGFVQPHRASSKSLKFALRFSRLRVRRMNDVTNRAYNADCRRRKRMERAHVKHDTTSVLFSRT